MNKFIIDTSYNAERAAVFWYLYRNIVAIKLSYFSVVRSVKCNLFETTSCGKRQRKW